MSLPKDREQKSLFEVGSLLDELFAHRDRRRFAMFAEKVMPALSRKRAELEELYCADNGRPAVDPVILSGVTLLQFTEKSPDRQAAERTVLDLGWKRALGLPLEYEGFDATTLVYFRDRLREGGKERIAFDAVLEILREEKLIKKRSKQRLDSTHILGYVSQMSTLELVRETMRLAIEELQKQESWQSFSERELFEERYCESQVDWREQGAEKLRAKLQQAGEDGYRLLQWVEEQGELTEFEEALREGKQVQLLQRVLEEQFEWNEGQLQRRKELLSGTVCNPHDPEAQWASKDPKGRSAWVGYKVQIVETVPEDPTPKASSEPTEQFITEITTTEAIASDIDGMNRALKTQEAHGQEAPTELFVDAAYVSDDTLFEAQERDTELVGPARPSPQHHAGFPSEQFHVNNACRRALCPAGKTSSQCSRIKDNHKGNEYYRYEWGKQCDGCALQKQCTNSKTGRRILTVGIHHDLLQARRKEMKTEAFQKRLKQRAAIEGTVSEGKRSYGLGRTRYRGLKKTTLANHFIGAACNVNRYLRLLMWVSDRQLHGGVAVAT